MKGNKTRKRRVWSKKYELTSSEPDVAKTSNCALPGEKHENKQKTKKKQKSLIANTTRPVTIGKMMGNETRKEGYGRKRTK